MAAKKEPTKEEEAPRLDMVEEPYNNPPDVDNAPHGRQVQGLN